MRNAALLFLIANMIAVAVMGVSPFSGAATSRGIDFADRITVETNEMTLRGIGILRKYFIKGYLVGLYLPEGVHGADALRDVPKRLEYYFFRNMEAEDFQSTGMPLMARNVGEVAAEQLRAPLEAFNRLYRNVAKGQRYSITYLPGKGTELALEGKSLGWVEGAEFGAAYFSIWLGPQPVSDEVKEGLLDSRTLD